jgi:DNA repair exonuclease SbcCD ATPase subunit
MRPLKLTIQNFGPFTTQQKLSLHGLGLVAVVGENLIDQGADNNGSGKSSILDALMWGLTGETSTRKESTSSDAGLRADEVVNDRVGKDCVVTVEFEADDGAYYRVTRWRKAKIGEKRGNGVLLERRGDGVWVAQENLDAANVQAAINAALGFDREMLAQTVVRGQEDAFSFAQATPKERFAVFTRIEGLEELDAWEARFRERQRGASVEIATLQADLAARESGLAVLRDEAARAQTSAQQWEADRQARLTTMRQNSAALQATVIDLEARTKDAPQHEARIREIDAQLAPLVLPAEPPAVAQWEAFCREIQQRLGAARGDAARAAHKLAQLAALKPGACDTCGQPVSPEHLAQHRGAYEAEKAAADAQLAGLQQQDSEAAQVIQQARAQIEQARQALAAQRAQLERERGLSLSRLAAMQAEQQAHARNVEVLRRLFAEIQQAETQTNPIDGQRLLHKLAEVEALVGVGKDALARKQTEAGLLEWWVRNIPVLKAWVFDAVVAEITKEANRWLSILTGGLCWVEVAATATTKAGEVRDRISLKCFRWNKDGSVTEREFRQWSGGEKRRIVLALEWALATRLSQRAKSRCGFLALDEVDRHLDAAGRAGLLAALDALRAEKETVIVVSHDANLRAKPDVLWTVRKTAEGSTIEVARGENDQARSVG